jgi:septal ring factor EnvC (AmiA/AmiB activator)
MPQFLKLFLSLLLITGLFFDVAAQSESSSQSEQLKALQKELADRQQKLDRDKASASELRDILKRSELAIAATARSLNNTQNELKHNRAEQKTLNEQADALRKRIQNQQSQLAAQLRSAYMAGNYDYAKMLLNQEDALKFERVLTYYQYFNQARKQAISGFREDIAELEVVNARLEKAESQLQVLLANQQSQRAELQTRQKDRQATLAKLNAKISTESEAIAALKENEEALIKAIEEAERALREARREDVTLNGLANFRGKLIVPATGRLQRLFGKRRQGQVRWKGIVIEGNEGNPVRTIHQGRVLYADWLKGFGLVSIVDHGEGYMSVYGHNQALLKQAGDVVKAGETIALVGQSGGQPYPSLYFEVRHKGKALNPTKWIDF